MKLRLYKFTLQVLDEPICSDEDFEAEFRDFIENYLEAFHIEMELVEASDCMTFEGDLALADA